MCNSVSLSCGQISSCRGGKDNYRSVKVFHCLACRYFRHEETSESKVVREVGNVTAETEVTFEFGVRKQQKKKKEENKEGTTAKESGKMTQLSKFSTIK